ncbi:MAG TPA: polysaccharide deacetylase family protein [Anaerolineaceae bacterium]
MPENKRIWKYNCQAAVSLSYDDGLPSHVDQVAPDLETAGLRATFYVPALSDLRQRPEKWREVARRGHELGNHTLFHPCRSEPGLVRDFLDPAYNLCNYSIRRWGDEIDAANLILHLIDGRSVRTFGNTCWDNTIGPSNDSINLESHILRRFVAARGGLTNRPVDLNTLNFANLGTIHGDYFSFKDLKTIIDEVTETHGWVILTFHGVGKDAHRLFIDETEHQALLQYLNNQRNYIWTAPIIEVVDYLKMNG